MAKQQRWCSGAVATAMLVSLGLAVGCSSQVSTSGFKAEQKPSKEEIQRQIDQVKANTNMPAGVKEQALKKLEQDLMAAR